MRRNLWIVLLTALTVASPVRAQEDPLERVEELVRLGRSEEARTLLMTWWDGARSEAGRRDVQRGLWLRGRLTLDPWDAELDLQRLVIEFPSGPYSDLALFRLAQSAHARGEGDAAARHMAALIRDYPGSPVRRDAEAWHESAGAVPPPAERSRIAEPATAARPEVSSATPPAAQPATPPARTIEAPASDGTEGRYAVQLGAFSTESRADAVFQQALDAGLAVRLVHVSGSRLLHVRLGRFDDSPSARVFLERLATLGFTGAVVRDAHAEERIRG